MSLKAIGSVSLLNVNDGQQGEQGLSVAKEEVQYYLSTSDSSLSGGSWQDTQPQVTSGTYLWERIKTTRSDNSVIYSDAVYSRTTSGLVSTVDNIKNQITNKVWQSDISTQINSYDSSTVSTIRDRVSTTETKITGITSRVSDVESVTSELGTRMTTAESSITQNADNINLKVSKDSVISEINQSPEEITINANKVNIEGATIFSSGRLSAESLSENMLLDTYAPSVTKINAKYNRYFSDASNTSTTASFVSAGNEVLPDPNAKYFVRIKNTVVYNSSATDRGLKALTFYNSGDYVNGIGMVVGDTYRASCWVRQLEGSSNFTIGLGGFVNNVNFSDLAFVPTPEWQKYEKVFTLTDFKSTSTTVWSRLYFENLAGYGINGAGSGIGQIDMCGFKLERINAITASGRNLCLRSSDYNGWGKNNGTTFDGNIINFPTVTANTWREAWQNNNVPYSTVRNQKVTVTYKVKGTSGDLIQSFVCLSLVATATDSSRLKYVNKYVTLTANGEWQTVAFSAYVNDYVFSSGTGTPDYDNCYFMIRVGASGAADGRNGFQMKEIMVALGSDPCAWSPAPEDGVTQEQRIYYRINTMSAPDAPLTWVTSTTTANDTWTTKRMQYDETYKYLFTCIQRLNIGGAISNTNVLLDDTITVIDGGNIITGSVAADQIAANAVTADKIAANAVVADKIAANAITADKIATDAIHSRDYTPGTGIYSTEGMGINLAETGSIKSPNFAIDTEGNAYFRGALTATSLTIAPDATFDGDIDRFKGASFNWNLLLGTATPVTWTVALNTSNYMVKDCYKTISPVPKLFAVNDLVTIAFDWSTTATGGNFHVECGTVTPYGWGTVVSAEGGRSSTSNYVDISSSKQSGHFKVTFKIGTAQTGAADTLQWLRIRVDGADTSGKSFTISNAKAERGSNASDWSPAESEIHGISAVGLAMKVNYSSFTTANGGECYFHGFDANNAEADVDGWVMWNGVKLTITKGMWINPNGVPPANTPILHVFRTSVSPYHADVWWDSSLLKWRGYMYLSSNKAPDTIGDWVWNEATDCILAVYIATGNEAISSAQLFTTPKKFSELPNPNDIHSIVDTSIDGIEIGGRNLLQGTANPQISASYDLPYYNVRSGGDGVGSIESIEDSPVTGITKTFRITGNTTGNRDFVQLVEDFNILWTDGQWMFSCYARGIDASATALIRVYTANLAFQANISVGTSWTRIEVPISLNGSGAKTNEIKFQFGIAGAGSIEYIAPMLERGTKASAWSYAPEDIQGSIDNVNTAVANVRVDLTETQGSLSRIDGAVENLDGQIQTTYELASGAKSSANEANQKYDAISSIVNDYNNLRNYYLDFNPTPSGINGLIIGARNSDGSDNAFKTQITNDSLNFLQNGSAVAGINANEFFINQGTIETGLRVGNFVIFDEDGALNIKYEPRPEA